MKELYILPFDHRGTFTKMFGVKETELDQEKTNLLADYKHVIYEAFLKSIAAGVPKEKSAILVDEQFGAKIHEEAHAAGITHILTIEKSGQEEFDFEYGDKFAEHIEKFKPEYVKVLVRYNPANDPALNKRQCQRLKTVSEFCKSNGYKFLFELLAIATPAQLSQVGDDQEKYEQTLRWQVMVDSIKEIQSHGIEPDIWKIEGLNDLTQMQAVVEIARSGGRSEVGIVVLGRGESEEKVKVWLSVAAKIPGVVGFAVGRTVFKQPLIDLHENKISRDVASQKIADNFKGFVDLFINSKNS